MRYKKVLEKIPGPTEYDIQSYSGVLDTLESLPHFRRYVPNAEDQKKTIFYDFWQRPTLEYDPECPKKIDDAIDKLKELREKRYDVDAPWMKIVWIISIDFFGILLIWHVISMSYRCCKPDCKREGCCKNFYCFYGNMVSYSTAEVVMAVTILSISSVAMGKTFNKF